MAGHFPAWMESTKNNNVFSTFANRIGCSEKAANISPSIPKQTFRRSKNNMGYGNIFHVGQLVQFSDFSRQISKRTVYFNNAV